MPGTVLGTVSQTWSLPLVAPDLVEGTTSNGVGGVILKAGFPEKVR